MVPYHPLFPDRQADLRYFAYDAVRQPQVVSRWNTQPIVKRGWRLLGEVFNYSWAYQFLVFGLAFGFWAAVYYPTLYFYQSNNVHRGFDAAIAKEKAHKKKLREAELAAEGGAE